MIVRVFNQQKALSISVPSLKKMALSLLKTFQVTSDELIIYLVDKKTISKLHLDFFGDPTPTDCISFPMDAPSVKKNDHQILGEIFVCTEVACEYAEKHRKDPYEETCLYVIHGILHLLGYDDIKSKDRMEMRKQEAFCLDLIKKNHWMIQSKEDLSL